MGLSCVGQIASASPEAFFENKIRPVLVESCLKCHGGEKTSSGLRLDHRRHLIARETMARGGSPESYAEQVVATGFIAQSKRFGTGDLEDMHLIIEDTLDTMGKVVLGLGLRCARCHDHKYDPTTNEDYYALYGVFASTA